MRVSRHVIWTGAALAVLAGLVAVDWAAGADVTLAGMFAAAPLLAALGASPAATALVGLAAIACAIVSGLLPGDEFDRQDGLRALTALLVSNLAVWTALLRIRVETAAAEARRQQERYRALLQALSEAGEGLVVLEGERAVYVNDALVRLTGLPADQLTARSSILDLIEPDERDTARARMRRRVEEGTIDPDYRLRLRRADGGWVDIEVAGVPLEGPDGSQLVVVVRDVSERVRAYRRLAFLAEASAVFDASLDEEETLERIARVCVHEHADACVIVLVEPGQPPRRVAALARDPGRQAALEEYYGGDAAVQLDSRHPLVQVARSGRAVAVPDIPEAVRALGEGRAATQVGAFAERLGLGAAILVPLAARGRSHGVMALGFEELAPDEADVTLELFEDVASRAALAIDNARLYGERAHVAQTLQRSLLPAELPHVPGIELAARYAAAGAGNEVGGDFYDCFAGVDDEWVAVIGDVCGKGPEAAAVTALARYTLRTSVLHGGGPVEALRELNEVLLRENLQHRFCTVLCAMLTPGPEGTEVRLASGGHPLPILARAGAGAGAVGRPGTLLGVLGDPHLEEARVRMEPGDTLVMYTDGVTEASPLDDAFGPERLAEFVARLDGSDAGHVASAIEAHALDLQGGVARDDVALLVARRLP